MYQIQKIDKNNAELFLDSLELDQLPQELRTIIKDHVSRYENGWKKLPKFGKLLRELYRPVFDKWFRDSFMEIAKQALSQKP